MARCYSGSDSELVYHLSCLYTLSSTLDRRSSKETAHTGEPDDDVASSSYSAAFEHVAGFIKENVLNVSQTVCSHGINNFFVWYINVRTSRAWSGASECRTFQLKKRLAERLGDCPCVQFLRGSVIQRLSKQQAFKRRSSSSLRCQEGLLVLRLQQTMPQELSDQSSDTVMDVTDLADLDVYSELTTESSSRLSTVEVFDTAIQLRGLVQSMKSSVPPVPHADDMLMYSHLRSSCPTSWSESCRVLQCYWSNRPHRESCCPWWHIHCRAMSVAQDLIFVTSRGVHRCNSNLQHVALALKLLPTSSLWLWTETSAIS